MSYFPALPATYSATAAICASLSWPLNAGIAPPPTVTWWATTSFDGFSWSRFGPTLPLEPAAFRVWQPPHPAETKTCLPSGFGAPCGAPLEVEPPDWSPVAPPDGCGWPAAVTPHPGFAEHFAMYTETSSASSPS